MLAEAIIKSEQWADGPVEIPVRRGGDGQPMLFLNSGEAMHRSGEWIDALAGHWQLHAPGYPGGGGSEFSDQIRGVGDLALLYLDLLDRIGAERTVVVGASFGGWVAAEMAVRCSERIAALVLIDPVGIKISGRTKCDITDIHSLLPDNRKAALYHSERHRNFKYAEFSEEALEAIVRDRTAEVFYSWNPYLHNPTLKGWLHRIKCPTLVLWGEGDGVVPVEYGREYAASIPGASFATIPDSGHFPHVENPEPTLAAIRKFVDGALAR